MMICLLENNEKVVFLWFFFPQKIPFDTGIFMTIRNIWCHARRPFICPFKDKLFSEPCFLYRFGCWSPIAPIEMSISPKPKRATSWYISDFNSLNTFIIWNTLAGITYDMAVAAHAFPKTIQRCRFNHFIRLAFQHCWTYNDLAIRSVSYERASENCGSTENIKSPRAIPNGDRSVLLLVSFFLFFLNHFFSFVGFWYYDFFANQSVRMAFVHFVGTHLFCWPCWMRKEIGRSRACDSGCPRARHWRSDSEAAGATIAG